MATQFSISLSRSHISTRYRDEKPYVCLFQDAVDPEIIFMGDTVPYHYVILNEVLGSKDIQHMHTHSLNLNSTEDFNPINMGYAWETTCCSFAPTRLYN